MDKESDIVNKLVKSKRLDDLFILSRYYYRVGDPLISDKVYKKMELSLPKVQMYQEKLQPYFDRTYDDDPVPMDLLEEFGIRSKIISPGINSPYGVILTEDESLSIRAYYEENDAYDYFMNHMLDEIIISLKVDGAFTKTLYEEIIKLGCSRGRHSAQCYDWTKGLSRVLPQRIGCKEQLRIEAECYAEKSYLPTLREKYDKGFKTEKSSAQSLLHVPGDDEDFRHVHCLVHNIGLKNFDKRSDSYEFAKSLGFEVVPYIIVKPNTVPKDRQEFSDWLCEVCDYFAINFNHIPSDGLVVDMNLKSGYMENVTGQYTDRNFALKFNHWEGDLNIGIIKNIILDQKRVYGSVRIELEPMFTRDNCSATYLTSYNPSILFTEKLNIGDKVHFIRDSGAINKIQRINHKAKLNAETNQMNLF